jgi:hypothetical protein
LLKGFQRVFPPTFLQLKLRIFASLELALEMSEKWMSLFTPIDELPPTEQTMIEVVFWNTLVVIT